AQPYHAQQYLKIGPNYIFYLNGKPFAQWDPDSRQFLNTKDGKFTIKRHKTGIMYADDPTLAKFLKLLGESGIKLPAYLKQYTRTEAEAEQLLQKKIEKGLTLQQRVEVEGTRVLYNWTPEEEQQLYTQGTTSDILYYINFK